MRSYSFIRIAGLFITIIIAILAIAFFLGRQTSTNNNSVKQEHLAELGFYLFNEPRTLSPVTLSALDDSSVSLPLADGKWHLINFGYMFCPDICPINLRMLAVIQQYWQDNHPESTLVVDHVTFDPKRDTPENLQAYLEYHHPDFNGFTGELDAIRQLARQLNVTFIHDKPDQYGNYFISHSDSIALLNPNGNFIGLFKGPYEVENVKAVLSQLVFDQ